MKKIIIVVANTRWFGKTPFLEPIYAVPILAAELNGGGYHYEVIDCNGMNYTEEECIEHIRRFKPDIVLISALSVYRHMCYHKVAELTKRVDSRIITIMGGVYPTTCYEYILEDENIDYIMLGHAEQRLCGFLDKILKNEDIRGVDGIGFREHGRTVINPVTSYVGDLEKMAIPDYSKIDLSPYMAQGHQYVKNGKRSAPILTSYGCPYNCIFCAVRTVNGRKVAFREVEDIINEIRYLKETYQIDMIRIFDDNVLVNQKRAKQLFGRIIEEKFDLKIQVATSAAWQHTEEIADLLAEAGCHAVGISIESGTERVLHQIIRKKLDLKIVPGVIKMLKERNIFVQANIVIGFPGETWEEIRQSIAFGEKCDPDLLNLFVAEPMPKTDLYKLAKEEGCLGDDFSFFSDSDYAIHSKGHIYTDEFTPTELETLRAYEWDRINFSTEEKRKRFCEFRGITEEELAVIRRNARRALGTSYGFRKR